MGIPVLQERGYLINARLLSWNEGCSLAVKAKLGVVEMEN
jgi:hypothetical protein